MPAAAKKRPKTTRGKRKKAGSSDAVRAVILTAVLIFMALCISMAIIIVRPPIKESGGLSLEPSLMSAPVKTVPPVEPERQPEPSARIQTPAAVVPVAPPIPAAIPVPVVAIQPVAPVERPRPPEQPRLPEQPPPKPRPEYKGTVVLVIDDAGNNLRELEPFLRFPGPLTIAVLPGLPHSAEAARRIRAAGKEVFLHQPMEALGGPAPGPGAIYAGMSAAEIRETLRQNIAEVGPVAGMNNHQGSKITMDQAAMETVLAFCREQQIYFLDSRTTSETAAPAAAQRLGMKIGERNTFIDNEQDKTAMNRSIKDGLARAEQRGSVVMIGHTWSPELAPLLSELYPSLTEQGYTFSDAGAYIAGTHTAGIHIADMKN